MDVEKCFGIEYSQIQDKKPRYLFTALGADSGPYPLLTPFNPE